MAQNLKDLVKKNKKYAKEELNLNELIDRQLHTEQVTKPKTFIPAFHPSMISKGVECQLWWFYFLKNTETTPEEWSDENLTAMAVGKAIHNETQHILYRMGILEGVYKCVCCGHKFWATSPTGPCGNCKQEFKSWEYVEFKEVPIQVGLIRGHADGLLNLSGNRFLLELKSIKNVDRPNATYGYERLGTQPLDDHFMQAQLYLHGWAEIAKTAPLGEEVIVDDTGKLSTEKLEGPVYDGARIIGPVNQGIIEYVAKNSSEKKSYLIKRNQGAVQFILDEMQLIWKAYLEDSMEELKGADCNTNKSKCKRCGYKKVCSWT
jgi:hypothetical protein